MHIESIEILPVGADGRLFQICDGEHYAHLEMENQVCPWGDAIERITNHPEIVAYLHLWVRDHGVLVGSRNPPCIHWEDMEREVPAARLV